MNNPFDRTTIARLERPLSGDHNREFSQEDRTLRDILRVALGRNGAGVLGPQALVSYSGFIGDGMRVVPASPASMAVQVSAGFGFFYAPLDLPQDIGEPQIEGVHDLSSFKPVYLAAPSNFVVPASPGSGQSRIDIIEAKVDRRLTDSTTRRLLNVDSKAYEDTVVPKTLTFGLDGRTGTVSSPSPSTAGLSYKVGAAAATGAEVEPSVTTGYVKIARINVGPATTTVTGAEIVDRRPLVSWGGAVRFNAAFRLDWNGGSPTVLIDAMDAPPGCHVCLFPLAERGSALVFALGGDVVGGSMTITGSHFGGLNDSTKFSLGIQKHLGDQVYVVNSTFRTELAAATPPIAIGIGQSVLIGQINSRYVLADGTSNNTDAVLDDMRISVSGSLNYIV